MPLVYIWLVILMLVCGAFLIVQSRKPREHFETTTTLISEIDVMKVYDRVLQRQPSAKELTDALSKIKDGDMTLDDLGGRLMDTDEYERIIKVQSNTLTPELDKMIHERKQLAYLASVYLSELTQNIPPEMLMPLRDVYIYLDYSEPALRLVLQDAKYGAFEKRLKNEFQLSKEKTLSIFDEMFDRKALMNKVRDLKVAEVATNLNDPPAIGRAFDSVTDKNPSGAATVAVVAKDPVTNTKAVVPVPSTNSTAKTTTEKFENYTPELDGAYLRTKVYRTINDKDSNSEPVLFDVEQRSKEVFDIHKVAKKLDDTPDAFVYVPTIPVRYETPVTHFASKPPDNYDPFVVDLYGCMKAAPIMSS